MPPIRIWLAATAFCAALVSATPAYVHPHVFAEARLDVVLGPDGTVNALRHVWRFDDVFSSTVLVEFDENRDLKLDEAELGEVAKTVKESTGEYNWFQTVTAEGKDVEMMPPDPMVADFQDNQLLIIFESKPKQPLKLGGKVTFGVYDPTFYTSIDFPTDEVMNVEGLPPGCQRKVVRPNPDEAIKQNQDKLTQAFYDEAPVNDISKMFATRLEITCNAAG